MMTKNNLFAFAPAVLLATIFASYYSHAETGNASKSSTAPSMSAGQSVVLGVVEGVTEYLPVSSTGHLVLAQRIMGMGGDDAGDDVFDAYAICIQLGAILAVLFLYFGRVKSMLLGVLGRDKEGRGIAINLILSFLPAAVIGLLFDDAIKERLFGLKPIAAAWLAGGLVLVALAFRKSDLNQGSSIAKLTMKQAVIIGLAQSIAMWPGTSRSLITIVGGALVGLNLAAAVEYSFLLGLVTLSAATVFEGLKSGADIITAFGLTNSLIGVATAFIAAAVSVKLMVSFLNKKTMLWFGVYRIALSAAVFAAMLAGRL